MLVSPPIILMTILSISLNWTDLYRCSTDRWEVCLILPCWLNWRLMSFYIFCSSCCGQQSKPTTDHNRLGRRGVRDTLMIHLSQLRTGNDSEAWSYELLIVSVYQSLCLELRPHQYYQETHWTMNIFLSSPWASNKVTCGS